jgi:5-carboxymethyl-2-hydroxymuconate isomerase
MATAADSLALAAQARRSYVERLLSGVPSVVHAVEDGAKLLATQTAEHSLQYKRRDVAADLKKAAPQWINGIISSLRGALISGMVSNSRPGDLPLPGGRSAGMSLVDDDTIEVEILSSRLALAMMDRASWQFTDLRSRISSLEKRDELDTNDVLRPHVLARIVTGAWRSSPMTQDAWRTLQAVLHEEFSHFAEEAYHETNRWLIQQRVLPEIDLRPFIRRTRNSSMASVPSQPSGGGGVTSAPVPAGAQSGFGRMSNVGEETRMMTRAGGFARGSDHAEAVLGRLNRLVGRQLPDFAGTAPMPPASPGLRDAIAEAQQGIQRRLSTEPGRLAEGPVSTPALLEELQQRKAALKKAAATPVERATIEIVALLFQSILTEERIPAVVRVWFARLQMPVLRVAVTEPDFFATVDHPARRLIDRMGACVMGFDATSRAVADTLEKEIKRIVQVVEAYPDTGRRVFQTVLTEFEKFLEHYFKNENEMTRKGVSLAQQVEQRETLAIQYTIELRKMLNEVPVQEGVRDFLFQVWADVMAMTAVKYGAQSAETKAMKRVAADLIWSASAKVSREERAEVIRRLPPLLKTLREGMDNASVNAERQDEHIQKLNNSLAAAFTAKTAAIPRERLEELMQRLETLEELLPETEDIEIDESLVLDLSGHESSELEVVGEGGSMPTPAMLTWARELQVGGWYMLDYRNRNEAVQLVWQGMRRQLTLFVSPHGRGILFQQHRLAAFLQAGLLLPAQDESLTVRATRSALAKLDVDPQRLLN